jgi:benzylsuccinate CoA-transferase BbsF subunit
MDARELALELQASGVPAAPVQDAKAVVDDDPQLAVRGHWVRLTHAEMGETIYNAPPFRFSRTDGEIRVPAPLIGEHTVEICTELLGMDRDDVEGLIAEGVLA